MKISLHVTKSTKLWNVEGNNKVLNSFALSQIECSAQVCFLG